MDDSESNLPGPDEIDEAPGVDLAARDETSPPADIEVHPRRSVFVLEGRAAPGLYTAGWVLTGLGLLLTFVFLQASEGHGLAVAAIAVGGLTLASLGLIAAAGAQGLQRKADHIAGFAGPSPFLVFAAAFALINLGTIPLLVAGSVLGLHSDAPPIVVASLVLNLVVYVILIRLLVVGTGALTWGDMGVWRPSTDTRRLVGDLWAGFSLALPTILATLILASLLVRLLGVSPEPPLPPARGAAGLVANLLAAAVLAPIGEEFFFRGYATTAWARRLGAESALVRGALFFAFVHVLALTGSSFDQAIRIAAVTFVSRLPVAYLLGWLYLRRRSLYASIALHATFNGLLIILSVMGS